jgi:hypothetical protein
MGPTGLTGLKELIGLTELSRLTVLIGLITLIGRTVLIVLNTLTGLAVLTVLIGLIIPGYRMVYELSYLVAKKNWSIFTIRGDPYQKKLEIFFCNQI